MKQVIIILTIGLCLLGTNLNVSAAPQLELGSVTIQPGKSASLNLTLSGGTETYAGVNAKIILPPDVTVTDISNGELLSSDFRTDYHNLTDNNEVAFIAYSSSTTFAAAEGVLLTLTISASDAAESGTYDVNFASTDSNPFIHSKYALSNTDGTQSVTPSTKAGTLTISQECEDADNDDLCDSWENQYFENLNQDGTGDDDGDGYTNEQEETNGTDPTIKPGEDGDVNSDHNISLEDGIIALRISCGINSDDFSLSADINGDTKIGLEEVIFVLQKVSGVR